MKNIIFWDVTPCIQVQVYRRFGGTYCLYTQRGREKQANVSKKFCFFLLLHAHLFLLCFEPEDGGKTFLRSIGELQPYYTKSHPKDSILKCIKLKN
jgi:hypothetical protein